MSALTDRVYIAMLHAQYNGFEQWHLDSTDIYERMATFTNMFANVSEETAKNAINKAKIKHAILTSTQKLNGDLNHE